METFHAQNVNSIKTTSAITMVTCWICVNKDYKLYVEYSLEFSFSTKYLYITCNSRYAYLQTKYTFSKVHSRQQSNVMD